jgi:excisionase family DNA binding protein
MALATETYEIELPVAPSLAYSVEDAAHDLGVSPKTVRRLIDRGTLKASRVGKRVVIRREDIEALLTAMQVVA